MKKNINFKIGGLEFKLNISLNKVKRMVFELPGYADDCHIENENSSKAIIKYYEGCKPKYLSLPKCVKAKLISLTPFRIKDSKSGKYVHPDKRKIVVDIYLW